MTMVSGEGVDLDLAHAGVGTRMVAGALDLVLQAVALIVFVLLDTLGAGGDGDGLIALVLVELVAVFAGYPIISEWLGRGRTLGKLALGLRVVRDDGGPIAFRHALVRGLSGLLLEKPGLFAPLGPAVALISIATTSNHKRIGDALAGTFVLRERAGQSTALDATAYPIPPALYGWASSLDLTRFDDQMALGVRQFILRADQLSPAARDQLGAQFAGRIVAVISPPPPPGVPPSVLLPTVLAERRRRAEAQHQRWPAP